MLTEYASNVTDQRLEHSPAYFDALITTLQQRHPDRTFRTTHCLRLLIELDRSTQQGDAPFEQVEDVYRDAIHMTLSAGRYLMHNAMRETLGQPRVTTGFGEISESQLAWLNRLLDQRKTWSLAVPATGDTSSKEMVE